jgi:hypothetical protein
VGEITDARNFAWLLAECGKGPRHGAGRKRPQQMPARNHSITLSALTSSDCGIVRPNALAVFD